MTNLPTGLAAPTSEGLDFAKELERFERLFIERALKQFEGNVLKTAKRANIPHNTLIRKIKQYGINPEDFK